MLSVFEHQSLDDEAFAHLSVSHKFRVAHISGAIVKLIESFLLDFKIVPALIVEIGRAKPLKL